MPNCGSKQRVVHCQSFTGLIDVVARDIIQSVQTIDAAMDVLDGELSFFIRARNTRERLLLKSRIGQILMNACVDVRYRIQVLGVNHYTTHLQCVNLRSGSKRECVALQGITLVVVTYGRAEIDSVGSRVTQLAIKCDGQFLAIGTHLGRALLRWGNKHLIDDIIQLQILVKSNLYSIFVIIHRSVYGDLFDHLGRRFVLGPTLGTYPSIGASPHARYGK